MADKETKTVEETKVEKVDINLDEIFDAAPGGDSITLPEEEKKPNIFSRKQRDIDTSFLDEPAPTAKKEAPAEETTSETTSETVETTETTETAKQEVKPKIDVDEVLGLNDDNETEDLPVKRGRKKIEGIADVFNKLIKDDKIVPFDDEKPLEEYSAKDYEELIQANLDMKNVYNTLKDGRVGQTRIDRKTQSLLYNGLVNPSYPSINGKNTNLLGHLLEKYQFVEPNYPLITEALWLLADPKGYKTNLMRKGENKAVEKTVRKLKTAQSQKRSSAAVLNKDAGAKRKVSRKLPRGNKNIFKRF
jgi:hypothetical protein